MNYSDEISSWKMTDSRGKNKHKNRTRYLSGKRCSYVFSCLPFTFYYLKKKNFHAKEMPVSIWITLWQCDVMFIWINHLEKRNNVQAQLSFIQRMKENIKKRKWLLLNGAQDDQSGWSFSSRPLEKMSKSAEEFSLQLKSLFLCWSGEKRTGRGSCVWERKKNRHLCHCTLLKTKPYISSRLTVSQFPVPWQRNPLIRWELSGPFCIIWSQICSFLADSNWV